LIPGPVDKKQVGFQANLANMLILRAWYVY